MIDVDFNQEETWWNKKASSEETDLEDERINRLLRWRAGLFGRGRSHVGANAAVTPNAGDGQLSGSNVLGKLG